MGTKEINNVELQDSIKQACRKNDFSEVTDEDLLNLKALYLSSRKVNDEESEIDLSCLEQVPNVEQLVLSKWIFSQEELENIFRLKNLKSVAFDRCGFIDVDFDEFDSIPDQIGFMGCGKLNFKFPKVKEINVHTSTIDFETIDFSEVTRIIVRNSTIENAKDLSEKSTLEEVNLDGTKIYAVGHRLMQDLSVPSGIKYSHEDEEVLVME